MLIDKQSPVTYYISTICVTHVNHQTCAKFFNAAVRAPIMRGRSVQDIFGTPHHYEGWSSQDCKEQSTTSCPGIYTRSPPTIPLLTQEFRRVHPITIFPFHYRAGNMLARIAAPPSRKAIPLHLLRTRTSRGENEKSLISSIMS